MRAARMHVTHLYVLVFAAAFSVICGYAAIAASDRVVPRSSVSIEQMLEWHREVAGL